MQVNLLADTKALCRVCMTDKDGHRTDLHDAAMLVAGQSSLLGMLKVICAPVFVKADTEYPPGMPTKVCATCRNAILAAFKLHQTCIETDRRLGKLLALKWELRDLEGEEEESRDPLKSGNRKDETLNKTVELRGDNHPKQNSGVIVAVQDEGLPEKNPLSQEQLPEFGQIENSGSISENVEMIKVEELDLMDESGNESHDYYSIDKENDDETQRICEICSEKFDKASLLVKHMTKKHQLYMCDICHETFGSQLWFSKHESLHSKAEDRSNVYLDRVDCSECGRTLADTAGLRAHLRTKCPKLKYLSLTNREIETRTCRICGIFFKSVRLLLRHLKNEHPVYDKFGSVVTKVRNKCSICHESFPTKSALTKHRRSHKPPPKCSICRKTFLTKEGLKVHMVRHTTKAFACDLCPKQFYTKGDLNSHNISHNKAQMAIFKKLRKCTKCDGTFATKKALIQHRKVHLESVNCPICGKTVISKATLKIHMIRHSDNKPHNCDLCPIRFYTKGELENHMLSHTNTRNNICDLCGAKFAKLNSLKRHVKLVHEGGSRPFECQICGFKLVSSTQLKRHLLGHTKEKPYQCELCSSAFAKTDELAHHVARKHRGGLPYPCDRCDESFRLLTELRHHYPVHFQAEEQIEEMRFTTMATLQRIFAKDRQKLAEEGLN